MTNRHVAFRIQGAGDPIVLVHGVGSRLGVFEPVNDLLVDAGHQVISVDMPGMGDSAADEAVQPGPVGYANWLIEWLKAQGLERPHLVGNSMGGGIALEIGRAGAARAVTAFSPAGFLHRAVERKRAQAMLKTLRVMARYGNKPTSALLGVRPLRAAVLASMFGKPWQVSAERARADQRALGGADSFGKALADLSRYRIAAGDDPGALAQIPVTIAWGTRDRLLPYRTNPQRAAEALPFAQHVAIPKAGHVPFLDAPQVCADLILADAKRAAG